MKFTELLSEYQVPEWKSQYVDYKWGKKLLKKIPDDLGDKLARHRTFDEDEQGEPVPTAVDIEAQQQAINVDEHADHAISPRNASMTPGALLSGNLGETEPINSGSEHDHDYGAIDDEARDDSPDLGEPGVATHVTGVSPHVSHANYTTQVSGHHHAASEERLSRGHSGAPTPILLSKLDTSGGGSVKLPPAALGSARTPEMAPHRDSTRRESRSSPKITRSPFGLGTPKIKPDDHTNYDVMDKSFRAVPPGSGEKEFVAWLDSQLEKVNEFYTAKMGETHDRYRILVGQLAKLQRQKVQMRHQKLGAAKRTTQEGISVVERQIELPSLPKFPWLRKEKICTEDHPRQSQDSYDVIVGVNGDHERHQHVTISYAAARRQLKTAMQEFYRSIELLRSYSALNRTAFRKICKKYDKTTGRRISGYYMDVVDHTEFCNTDNNRLDIVATKVEDLYSNYFERGNRKHAIQKLRSTGVDKTYYFATFRGGIFFGVAIPFFVEALYKGCLNLVEHKSPNTQYLLQIWAGFFLILLFLLLFPLCGLVWTKYKINYTFIFEFNPTDHLDYRQFFEMPAFYFFLMSIFAWLTFYSYWESSFPAVYYPCIFLGVAVISFFMPIPIFYWSARQWLIRALTRILFSGLYPVEFRDFFIGDILCSMTYPLSNVALFFCLYSHEWSRGFHGSYDPGHCGSSHNRLMGFFNALPGIFRWLQCLRRYADTGDWFPHLANMFKYSLTIMYYVAQSVWRINTTHGNRAFFIFFATINATYCYVWDICMDWSLMEFNSKNFLLRNNLTYKKKWPYYTAMVLDLILRFNWIWYAIFEHQIQQKQLVSFFVALSEILRRFMWMFFRMENEHTSNVKRFRASRDVPLPYTVEALAYGSGSDQAVDSDQTAVASGSELRKRPSTSAKPGTPLTDLEAGTPATANTPGAASGSSLRKFELSATPVIAAISSMVQKAHTADFQRRKAPRDDAGKDSDGEPEDDEEDDEFED